MINEDRQVNLFHMTSSNSIIIYIACDVSQTDVDVTQERSKFFIFIRYMCSIKNIPKPSWKLNVPKPSAIERSEDV